VAVLFEANKFPGREAGVTSKRLTLERWPAAKSRQVLTKVSFVSLAFTLVALCVGKSTNGPRGFKRMEYQMACSRMLSEFRFDSDFSPILLCRHLHQSWPDFWKKFQRYGQERLTKQRKQLAIDQADLEETFARQGELEPGDASLVFVSKNFSDFCGRMFQKIICRVIHNH
jgi:hypothetical protein